MPAARAAQHNVGQPGRLGGERVNLAVAAGGSIGGEVNENIYIDREVQKLRELYEDLFNREFYALPIRTQLELQAEIMTKAHRDQDRAVVFQITSWHPELVGKSDAQILDYTFTMNDGRVTIAREYGYRDWDEVEAIEDRSSDADFEHAVNTMLAGDLSSLIEQIGERSNLVRARSKYGHGATLLHYVGANGVESYRQVVPLNLAKIVEFLLASGADHMCEANIYGGSTPRALFESSKHSYESRVHENVVEVFKKHEQAA
jgi:hypothetical protein